MPAVNGPSALCSKNSPYGGSPQPQDPRPRPSHSGSPTCSGFCAIRTTWASSATAASSTPANTNPWSAPKCGRRSKSCSPHGTSPARNSANTATTWKGSVYCGICGSRLVVSHAKNRHGTIYPYFISVGRQQKRTSCTQQAIRIDQAEEAVVTEYATIRLTADQAEQVRDFVLDEIVKLRVNADSERERQSWRLRALLGEQKKLLDAHYADAIPLSILKTEQARINTESPHPSRASLMSTTTSTQPRPTSQRRSHSSKTARPPTKTPPTSSDDNSISRSSSDCSSTTTTTSPASSLNTLRPFSAKKSGKLRHGRQRLRSEEPLTRRSVGAIGKRHKCPNWHLKGS